MLKRAIVSPRLLAMLRLLIRFFGLLLLAAGFVALIVDGTRSLAGGGVMFMTLDKGMRDLFPSAYHAAETAASGSVVGVLWDPFLTTALLFPASAALCAAGAAMIVVSHKPQAGLGYWSR
jgi:hypothetical protein